RLRKWFENNARKGKNDEDSSFSNPQEQKIFYLIKRIWDKEGLATKGSNGKGTLNAKEAVDGVVATMKGFEIFRSWFGVGNFGNEFLKHALNDCA
ncbi:hypothetical protein Gotri_016093, partial [Gossypium trilobum]|nr:hypothetical protein [Gossypium trilobum]